MAEKIRFIYFVADFPIALCSSGFCQPRTKIWSPGAGLGLEVEGRGAAKDEMYQPLASKGCGETDTPRW
jgi:hypothetical protein